jgi:hypothetical protein
MTGGGKVILSNVLLKEGKWEKGQFIQLLKNKQFFLSRKERKGF